MRWTRRTSFPSARRVWVMLYSCCWQDSPHEVPSMYRSVHRPLRSADAKRVSGYAPQIYRGQGAWRLHQRAVRDRCIRAFFRAEPEQQPGHQHRRQEGQKQQDQLNPSSSSGVDIHCWRSRASRVADRGSITLESVGQIHHQENQRETEPLNGVSPVFFRTGAIVRPPIPHEPAGRLLR